MKHFLISAMLAVMPLLAWAQPQGQPKDGPRFDPQKFQQMVEETLTKAGGLTDDEAKAFFPLYNEMRGKQREMGRQMRDLKRGTPADTRATILKIKHLQVEMAELEQTYYERFLRIVPPEKLFRMMQAEDDFHRRMVQGDRRREGKHGGRPRQQK